MTLRSTRSIRLRWLQGALACLAFLLPQWVVPLHLVHHDHVLPAAGDRHVHSHGGTTHGAHEHELEVHGHVDMPLAGHHHPHPEGDHLDQQADPALPTVQIDGLVALPLETLQALVPAAPAGRCSPDPRHEPRPPPGLAASVPRAPPIVA